MRRLKLKYNIKKIDTQNKIIRGRNQSYLRKGIGCSFTYAKTDFLTLRSPNSTLMMMILSKYLKRIMIMHIC